MFNDRSSDRVKAVDQIKMAAKEWCRAKFDRFRSSFYEWSIEPKLCLNAL